MAQGGFGRDSGPNTGPRPQSFFGNFTRAPSPSPPRSVSPGKVPSFKEHGAQTYQRPPDHLPWVTSSNTINVTSAEVQNTRRANSPHYRSPDAISSNTKTIIIRTQSPPIHQKNQFVSSQRPDIDGIQQ